MDSQSSYPKKQEFYQKKSFFGARYPAGFRLFSIDSTALKSMLELWFDSFKTGIDRDHRAGRWVGGGPGTRHTMSRPVQSNSEQNPDLSLMFSILRSGFWSGFDWCDLGIVRLVPGPPPSMRPARLSRSIPVLKLSNHSSNILFRAVESIQNQRNPAELRARTKWLFS